MTRNTDPLVNSGEVRTDIHCHSCSKTFIALLDYDREGNHVAICPHCEHEHFRVIKGGKITEERWNGDYGPIEEKEKIAIKARRTWRSNHVSGYTASASEFIRQRWLERHH